MGSNGPVHALPMTEDELRVRIEAMIEEALAALLSLDHVEIGWVAIIADAEIVLRVLERRATTTRPTSEA